MHESCVLARFCRVCCWDRVVAGKFGLSSAILCDVYHIPEGLISVQVSLWCGLILSCTDKLRLKSMLTQDILTKQTISLSLPTNLSRSRALTQYGHLSEDDVEPFGNDAILLHGIHVTLFKVKKLPALYASFHQVRSKNMK